MKKKQVKSFFRRVVSRESSFKVLSGKQGMAMLEAFVIIWVIFVFLGATLGSWGIAHTAVLNSIAARNYSFFLFNNRSDMSYLRDFAEEYGNIFQKDTAKKYYREDASSGGSGKIFAYISSENGRPGGTDVLATLRKADFRSTLYQSSGMAFLSAGEHNKIWQELAPRNQNKKASPAWIMVGYGICLSAKCGDPR